MITIRTAFILVLCSIAALPTRVFSQERTEEQNLAMINSRFAGDLYQELRQQEGNLFFSPYSISVALAMAYGGARGKTESEFEKVLGFSDLKQNIHKHFSKLLSAIDRYQSSEHVELKVANSLWPHHDYTFLESYLDLLNSNYGVTLYPVDFVKAHEAARAKINNWVADKTNDKITELIPAGVLDSLTRLVLTNAIYFKSNWKNPFDAELTKKAPFYMQSGDSTDIELMHQEAYFKFADLKSFKIIELPYAQEELAMLVILPAKRGGLSELEGHFSAEKLELWRSKLTLQEVVLELPRLKMTSTFELSKFLSQMGIVDAFSRGADFSGMNGNQELQISAVLHKAFVEVNEQGSEAAAATGVVVGIGSIPAPPPTFRADHPFIFLITENVTGSILFMGRVVNL